MYKSTLTEAQQVALRFPRGQAHRRRFIMSRLTNIWPGTAYRWSSIRMGLSRILPYSWLLLWWSALRFVGAVRLLAHRKTNDSGSLSVSPTPTAPGENY